MTFGKPPPDPWFHLQSRTAARIGLGRAGVSLPTREVLAFALAHAKARDAVHAKLDVAMLQDALVALELQTLVVASQAIDRSRYLARPDQGRRLNPSARQRLALARGQPYDVAIVIGDGLSASAVNAHAVPLVSALLPHLEASSLKLAPVTIAEGARVALGDEIGSVLQARIVAVLIGERPGLSSPDSLGIYLTYDPRPGRSDAERNCISNVRGEGLRPAHAAAKLAWLLNEALLRRLTGVELKDESDLLPMPDGVARLEG